MKWLGPRAGTHDAAPRDRPRAIRGRREEKTLLRLIIMALLVLPASVAWAAECAPEKMVRIVTRDATPGIDPQSFAALPKTLYRVGNARGRVEEMPDAARGVHGLIVVNEPDGWIVNLHDKSGRHVVDPGPSLIFRAPIAWPSSFFRRIAWSMPWRTTRTARSCGWCSTWHTSRGWRPTRGSSRAPTASSSPNRARGRPASPARQLRRPSYL